jgi:histone H2B
MPAKKVSAEKKPAKKSLTKAKVAKVPSASAGGEVSKKKKSRRNSASYSSYIYKILKQVHPDTGSFSFEEL